MKFTDRSSSLSILANDDGPNGRYLGQTFAIAVGDVDGDGRLDLYVNHHTDSPSELIYGFAFNAAARHEVLHYPRSGHDQHGATFWDIDQDGDLDLLETRGGGRDGDIPVGDTRYWNSVYENVDGVLSSDVLIEGTGLERGPGRDRMLSPVNVDGRLHVFAGSYPKKDGTWKSELMRETPDGSFVHTPKIDGDLAGAHFAVGAHLGFDPNVDVVVVYDDKIKVQVDAGLGRSAATNFRMEKGRAEIADAVVADLDGDGRQEIVVAVKGGTMKVLSLTEDGLVEVTDGKRLDKIGVSSVAVTVGDFDNDGDIDIAALHEGPGGTVSVYRNDDGHFVRAARVTIAGLGGDGSELVSGDFNGDGRLDLLLGTGEGDPKTTGGYGFLQGRPNGNHWLSVELDGIANERDGLGARVYVKTADGQQMQEQDGGVHKWMQDSQWLHFGLGDEDTVERIVIRWADDTRTVFYDVAADQHVVLSENGTMVGDFDV